MRHVIAWDYLSDLVRRGIDCEGIKMAVYYKDGSPYHIHPVEIISVNPELHKRYVCILRKDGTPASWSWDLLRGFRVQKISLEWKKAKSIITMHLRDTDT